MRIRHHLAPVIVGGLAALACNLSGLALGESPTAAPVVAAPTVAQAPTEPPPATETPAVSTTVTATRTLRPRRCQDMTDFSGWCLLGDGAALDVAAPVEKPQFFDYAPATNRALYGSHPYGEPTTGPGRLALTDLWSVDLSTNEAQPVVDEDVIVKAFWAPNGQDLVYLRATDVTYELRLRTASGEDTLLAVDVAPLFAVSPAGDRVAFAREPGRGVDVRSGLYVISITGGEERWIAEVDRSGGGSADDRPIWSPDGQTILLPVSSREGPTGMLRATAAGGSGIIGFDEALADQPGYGELGAFLLWHPDSQSLIGTGMTGHPMTNDARWWVVRYRLDAARELVTGMVVVAEDALLLGWDRPGESVWVQPIESTPDAAPLPVPVVVPLPE
jgi:hypothetical protein